MGINQRPAGRNFSLMGICETGFLALRGDRVKPGFCASQLTDWEDDL